jgi:hypothetical protein
MARQLGRVDVDKMLDGISYSQAKEWEIYSRKNPLPHEQIMAQIALVAYRFSRAFIKFKNGSHYEYKDFMPEFGVDEKGEIKTNVIDSAKTMVAVLGDEKAKKRFFSEEELNPILGKDGKRYKYALEEKIPQRTTPPKNKRRTRFGNRYDKIKSREEREPVRMKKVYNEH